MLAYLASSMIGSALKLGVGGIASKAAANAKADIAAVPTKVKLALLAAAAAIALFVLHQHHAHAALKAADQAGYDRAQKEDAAALKEWRQRAQTAEAAGKAISQTTRSKNDEANRGIAADAGALRVRGPGAARCGRVGHPAVPAAGSQPGATDHQPADAAGDPLPAAVGQPDLAAVPWGWLVGRAEQCDLDRAEALAWRSWYEQQAAAWDKLKTGGVKP